MKILLVADVPGWAWDYKAQALIKNLPEFQLHKTYSSYYHPGMTKAFDGVFFFGWNEIQGDPRQLLSSISSHNYYLLDKDLASRLIPQFKGLVTVSKELYKLIKEINPNTFCAPNGVDHKLFVPNKPSEKKKLVVGWVGQKLDSSAGLSGRPYDVKGYHLIMKEIMKRLENEKNIEFKINDNTHHNGVHLEKMAEFYHDVDVQLCTSFAEGTPNPLFEAAACGTALISTMVGCAPELISDSFNGFLVESYNKEEECEDRVDTFIKHLLYLKDNKDVCRDMGKRSREIIEKSWTWEQRAKQYIPLFELLLN